MHDRSLKQQVLASGRAALNRRHLLGLGAAGVASAIAARPGLGTINHTLLTLEAARALSLEVAAVVLTPWPDAPSDMERSNRETIERLGAAEVATLPPIARADPALLAGAGSALPLDRWLAPASG